MGAQRPCDQASTAAPDVILNERGSAHAGTHPSPLRRIRQLMRSQSRSTIADANSEHFTSVAPSISRAKS